MSPLQRQDLLPATATAQLRALAQLMQQTLDTSLLGLILHGSAATAGFETQRSDLDLLAIVNAALTQAQCEAMGQGVLLISNDPHPIEISIVHEQYLTH